MRVPTTALPTSLMTIALAATALVTTSSAYCAEATELVPAGAAAVIGAAPPAPSARRASESAEQRRALLRRHTLDRALARIARQEGEAVYRYVPTPRPEHLGAGTR